jgi:predicted Rossmann fold nucleotide-binding protein DprA/Smf involved in DNA uptake
MLTDDAKSVVALTTRLGSRDRPSLTAQGWDRFSTALRDAGHTPASVFELKGSIADIPGVDEADRIESLLADASAATLEVDDLQSKGVWTLTIVDEGYPYHLKDSLGKDAPPVLFGVGEAALLGRRGIGIVGSRNVEEEGREVAESLAREAVKLGLPVVSGGARGVDQFSMNAAYSADGSVVGVLADSLLTRIRVSEMLSALDSGSTCLITQQVPSAGFSAGAAMSRNKVIYGLSIATIVVATDEDNGGTWAGATEALKKNISAVLVWRGGGEGPGNAALVGRGGVVIEAPSDLGRLLTGSGVVADQLSLLEGG